MYNMGAYMGNIILIILIPLIGTTIGSICGVLFGKGINNRSYKFIFGFSAGVMLASSVWSLILPAIDICLNIFPVIIGLLFGFGFILLIGIIKPNQNINMLNFTVTMHNIPEGFCVGVAIIQSILSNDNLFYQAYLLSLGIAIQNIPEGSIVSMNLLHNNSNLKAMYGGFLSGVVEPVASLIAMLLISLITPLMPYSLAFAAGAMIYVVLNELIPNAKSNIGILGFFIGFIVMMSLDVIFG